MERRVREVDRQLREIEAFIHEWGGRIERMVSQAEIEAEIMRRNREHATQRWSTGQKLLAVLGASVAIITTFGTFIFTLLHDLP